MKHKSKGFHLSLTEVNGEQEYGHDIWLDTTSEEVAKKLAQKTAENWYESEPEHTDHDTYEFFGGEIVVRVERIERCSWEQFTERTVHVIYES